MTRKSEVGQGPNRDRSVVVNDAMPTSHLFRRSTNQREVNMESKITRDIAADDPQVMKKSFPTAHLIPKPAETSQPQSGGPSDKGQSGTGKK